jgi:uncharacterized membrane protein YcaP (DUF421 family)
MWALENPWWEYVVRSGAVYAIVFILLRVLGKKQIGELSPFDLVLLLIISEAVSASITGGDNSLGAAIICVTTFVVGNYLLDILGYKFRKVEIILEGNARCLIADGVIDMKVCESEFITFAEIKSALREHGIDDLKCVSLAMLETNGKVTIIKKENVS